MCAERKVAVLNPCPQARHHRTALAVGNLPFPWVIDFCLRKEVPVGYPPYLSKRSLDEREGSKGCTETFSDAVLLGENRLRAALMARWRH